MSEPARAEGSAADPALAPPLARYAGAEPPAPAWFHEAVNAPHERHRVQVEGAESQFGAQEPGQFAGGHAVAERSRHQPDERGAVRFQHGAVRGRNHQGIRAVGHDQGLAVIGAGLHQETQR